MIGPQIEITRDEFTSVIDTNDGRVANLAACAFQGLDDVIPLVAEPCVNHRREAGEGVNDRQYPDLATGSQLVMHEIHGPNMVGTGRQRHSFTSSIWRRERVFPHWFGTWAVNVTSIELTPTNMGQTL